MQLLGTGITGQYNTQGGGKGFKQGFVRFVPRTPSYPVSKANETPKVLLHKNRLQEHARGIHPAQEQLLGLLGLPHTYYHLLLLTQPIKPGGDRKSTRLNSSHVRISYAVFCLK